MQTSFRAFGRSHLPAMNEGDRTPEDSHNENCRERHRSFGTDRPKHVLAVLFLLSYLFLIIYVHIVLISTLLAFP